MEIKLRLEGNGLEVERKISMSELGRVLIIIGEAEEQERLKKEHEDNVVRWGCPWNDCYKVKYRACPTHGKKTSTVQSPSKPNVGVNGETTLTPEN